MDGFINTFVTPINDNEHNIDAWIVSRTEATRFNTYEDFNSSSLPRNSSSQGFLLFMRFLRNQVMTSGPLFTAYG